jgi:hypothetical protein
MKEGMGEMYSAQRRNEKYIQNFNLKLEYHFGNLGEVLRIILKGILNE